jgi:hypothetical protein
VLTTHHGAVVSFFPGSRVAFFCSNLFSVLRSLPAVVPTTFLKSKAELSSPKPNGPSSGRSRSHKSERKQDREYVAPKLKLSHAKPLLDDNLHSQQSPPKRHRLRLPLSQRLQSQIRRSPRNLTRSLRSHQFVCPQGSPPQSQHPPTNKSRL